MLNIRNGLDIKALLLNLLTLKNNVFIYRKKGK